MKIHQTLTLKSPLSGFAIPITNVPDPVFSQKMVGDGLSIDPTSQCLLAPCAGEIIQLHSAHHAITLKTENGIEVLIHIGLDTVNLKGQGFTPKVKTGDHVNSGQSLIEFDADFLATHAKSLLTEIVITNGEKVSKLIPHYGKMVAGKDIILELTLIATENREQSQHKNTENISIDVIIPNPIGLHARPAAVLANLAKKFDSQIFIQKDSNQANAKSVIGILKLEVLHNNKITIIAQGSDAKEAIDLLIPAIQNGLGDDLSDTLPKQKENKNLEPTEKSTQFAAQPSSPNILKGVAASPGIAIGKIYQLRQEKYDFKEEASNSQAERIAFDSAIEHAKLELQALQERLNKELDKRKASIFSAHQELLEDPELLDIVFGLIAKGKTAAFAWHQAYTTYAEQLSALKNELLVARANDLTDVGGRVLRLLTKSEKKVLTNIPNEVVLIAENLTPSDTANIDKSKVVGFCTTEGGASSHVAILARSLGIPSIAGISIQALDLKNGTKVCIDGHKGVLRVNPSESDMEEIKKTQKDQEKQGKIDLDSSMLPAITNDGIRVEVVANIGSLGDALQGIQVGAEGVGLLRSEFLFLGRPNAPTEDEQTAVYESIAKALGSNRTLIIRTLDVGGDKPLPYLPIPKEDNPFLGERGIRVGINNPEVLRTQLRAILRSSQQGNKVSVMFPMIATLYELRFAKRLIEEERKKLGIAPIPIGIMIEVPAAALMAEQFAKEVDFLSIGSNDLTQYTLAMDRGHPKLAAETDGLNPAVLSLIHQTVLGASKHGRWVGVCGGIASDPQAVPILIGLGVKELSVSVPSIPSIKGLIRRLSLSECSKLAQSALQQESASDVRDLTMNFLK